MEDGFDDDMGREDGEDDVSVIFIFRLGEGAVVMGRITGVSSSRGVSCGEEETGDLDTLVNCGIVVGEFDVWDFSLFVAICFSFFSEIFLSITPLIRLEFRLIAIVSVILFEDVSSKRESV